MRRYIELDLWRGVAVVGMVAFHFLYLLNFFGVVSVNLFEGGWHIFGSFIRVSFLLLVGISLVIAFKRSSDLGNFRKKEFKRFRVILGYAMVVSLVTYLSIGEWFVRFGILHLIAFSVLVGMFFVNKPKSSLALGIAIFLLTPVLRNSLNFGYFLGFEVRYSAVDYFPIFPWLSLPLIGIYFGHHIKLGWWKIKGTVVDFLVFMGRNALKIYMLHVPIMVIVLVLLGIISLEQIW